MAWSGLGASESCQLRSASSGSVSRSAAHLVPPAIVFQYLQETNRASTMRSNQPVNSSSNVHGIQPARLAPLPAHLPRPGCLVFVWN